MLQDAHVFSGFSTNDLKAAKEFYGNLLGLAVEESPMGLRIKAADGVEIFLYPKEDHAPATYTVLNFVVDDINHAVDELTGRGVTLEIYDNMYQDEKGIARGRAANMGPDIAWFKDPAGNILAILQN